MKALPKKGMAAIAGVGLAITFAGCTPGNTESPSASESPGAAEASAYTTREVTDGETAFVVVTPATTTTST